MIEKRFVKWAVLSVMLVGLLGSNSSGDEFFDLIKSLFPVTNTNGVAAADGDFKATHQQSHLIEVLDQQDQEGRALKCFCLNSEGNVLAAISADPGEIHILTPEGELLDTLALTVTPDAINTDADGNILIAGGGKLQRLSADGKVLLEKDAPHIAALKSDMKGLRKQVVEQSQMMVKSMQSQLESSAKQRMAARNVTEEQEGELSVLQAAIDSIADRREGDLTDAEREQVKLRRALVASINETIDAGITDAVRQQIEVLDQQMEFYEKYIEQQGGVQPTEEQIESQVQAMLAHKSAVASISAVEDTVFIATYSAKGHTFDVWKMDAGFEDTETLVTGLRGCCGQMDVQCCESGLFVAENARHRVCHYDDTGEMVNNWGKRAARGVTGFGGCCNPMNVAFGGDGSVYAAESGTGRIKRYSIDGELIELVGSVDLVPGCKKVSIAVSEDGGRVYMLDITRNHIIVMEAKEESSDEAVAAK